MLVAISIDLIAFQSTLPARGATAQKRLLWTDLLHFNPRSPHGERHDTAVTDAQAAVDISIHAPRTGSDTMARTTSTRTPSFQSTLPARGATQSGLRLTLWRRNFNPRSPHGERRAGGASGARNAGDFNPRSPHGERRSSDNRSTPGRGFQSTLPARGATSKYMRDVLDYLFQSTLPARGATDGCGGGGAKKSDISIHAPRTGSDNAGTQEAIRQQNFNPRSPHGERP